MRLKRTPLTWKQYFYGFRGFRQRAEPLYLPMLLYPSEVAQLYITHIGRTTKNVAALIMAYSAISAYHELREPV